MTNLDNIKNFTPEQMASLMIYLSHEKSLCKVMNCKYYDGDNVRPCNHGLACKQNLIEWLKGEITYGIQF